MPPTATLSASRRTIRIERLSPDQSAQIRMIPGRMWKRSAHVWEIPATAESLRFLSRDYPDVQIHPAVLDRIREVKSHVERIDRARNVKIVGDMGFGKYVNITPYEHQIRAFAIGCEMLIGNES